MRYEHYADRPQNQDIWSMSWFCVSKRMVEDSTDTQGEEGFKHSEWWPYQSKVSLTASPLNELMLGYIQQGSNLVSAIIPRYQTSAHFLLSLFNLDNLFTSTTSRFVDICKRTPENNNDARDKETKDQRVWPSFCHAWGRRSSQWALSWLCQLCNRGKISWRVWWQ